ncbi:hypothetical protein Hdeb2414_s0225g00839431 [Helianthus debilis subsp. tardiflorus]
MGSYGMLARRAVDTVPPVMVQGILPAITKLFPCAEHRYCLRHIHENMKLQFKRKLYRDKL